MSRLGAVRVPPLPSRRTTSRNRMSMMERCDSESLYSTGGQKNYYSGRHCDNHDDVHHDPYDVRHNPRRDSCDLYQDPRHHDHDSSHPDSHSHSYYCTDSYYRESYYDHGSHAEPPVSIVQLSRQKSGTSSLGSLSNHSRRFLSREASAKSFASSKGSVASSNHPSCFEHYQRSRFPPHHSPSSAMPYDDQEEPNINRPLIEVAPDLYMHLRGTEETMKAINIGAITVTTCSCCTIDLHCVMDAEFILCPDCRVVSPVNKLDNQDLRNGAGVALGVKTDTLMRIIDGL